MKVLEGVKKITRKLSMVVLLVVWFFVTPLVVSRAFTSLGIYGEIISQQNTAATVLLLLCVWSIVYTLGWSLLAYTISSVLTAQSFLIDWGLWTTGNLWNILADYKNGILEALVAAFPPDKEDVSSGIAMIAFVMVIMVVVFIVFFVLYSGIDTSHIFRVLQRN